MMAERAVEKDGRRVQEYVLSCPGCGREIRANTYGLIRLRRLYCRCGGVSEVDWQPMIASEGKEDPVLFLVEQHRPLCFVCAGEGVFVVRRRHEAGWVTRAYICPCSAGAALERRIEEKQAAALTAYRGDLKKQMSERGRVLKQETIDRLIDQRRKVQLAARPLSWENMHGALRPPDEDEQLALWWMSRGEVERVRPDMRERLEELLSAMEGLTSAGAEDSGESGEDVDVSDYGEAAPPAAVTQDELELELDDGE